MKRYCIILLLLILAVCLPGCTPSSDTCEVPVNVYYRRSQFTYGRNDSVIAEASLESAGHETDIAYLLEQYLKGLSLPEYDQTFPKGTTLVSYRLDGLTAKIVLSKHFATLSGIDLSVACACLSKTAMSLTGCREVIISAEDTQLDNNNYITVSANSYLLQDLSGEHQHK